MKTLWELVEDGDVSMAYRKGRGIRYFSMHLDASTRPRPIDNVFPFEAWEYR